MRDSWIRMSLFYLIQSIEEKLTGYIIQHLADPNPDFHLQAKNFRLFEAKNINSFCNISKFILDLRIKHHNLVNKSQDIPSSKYFELRDLIANMSLSMKAKLIKYAMFEFSQKVLSGFNLIGSKDEINFALDFFLQLNKLRNIVAHHDVVIDFEWKSSDGKFNPDAFISICIYFSNYKKIQKYLATDSYLKDIAKIGKADLVKIITENIK